MNAAASDWSALLDLALPVLAHVFGPPDPAAAPRWTLGGGTLPGTVRWPGHSLKYEPPTGEIDLLSAPLQAEPGYAWRAPRVAAGRGSVARAA